MGESEKIRHEIKSFLRRNGRVRSNELHPYIMKKCNVSETPVYREMKNLVINGEIIRDEINIAEIWYEPNDFKTTTDQIVKTFMQKLSKIDNLLNDWYRFKKKIDYPYHITPLKHILTALSLTEEQYIIYSYMTYLKFSDSFDKLQKEFDKRRNLIFHYSHIINEKHGSNDLLSTLAYEIDQVQLKEAYQYLHHPA